MIMDQTVSDKSATILVVDDSPENLALISNLLKSDYQVKIAINGKRALQIATSDTPPALILLDVEMPDMDGFEVCRQLKSNALTAGIPVIFLTAKSEMEDERTGFELGAVDYLTKPISPPIAMARVKNQLTIKTMADFLQEKNVELGIARDIAEKANNAKSKFISSMSHELRSPLNAVLGFAQLMDAETATLTVSQKDSLKQIMKAGWHLLTLINEILDLAKVESGKVSVSEESVPLVEVLIECCAMLEPLAQQRGIKLIAPAINRLHHVRADRIRLKQVVINLLSNAIKYNHSQGSVELCWSESQSGTLRVECIDTGVGLNAQQLSKLFQPFNRLGQENGSEEGTGIGLVMAKQLIELMGGTIGVKSKVGKGSMFWFELMSVSPNSSVAKVVEPVHLPPAVLEAKVHSLLYVEDNPENMLLMEQIIEQRSDLRLLKAVSGKLGIKQAKEFLPEVILMDINLPDMNGFEALAILQQDPVTAHIPVIAISANAMSYDIQKGIQSGFFRYITKPFKIDELTSVVDKALEFAATEQAMAT
jgi:CheY-like chemotaxis protein